MSKLMLVDGNSMLFRAYYATAYGGAKMTTATGIPTNAVFGFTSMFQKALEMIQPDAVMVAFDAGKHTFRHELYAEYKGGRQATPDDLIPQFQLVRDMLTAFSVKWVEMQDIEADDLIGTSSKLFSEAETYILTSDRDMLQLVDETTHVLLMKKGLSEMVDMTPISLKEEMGISASQVIDMKGLMGDKSDNIPGIPGVGEKTALKLLEEYGTVENVLEHSDDLKGALQKKVKENKDLALLSKQLATIRRDVELDFSLDDLAFKPNYTSLVQFLRSLEMNQLAKRFSQFVEDGKEVQVDTLVVEKKKERVDFDEKYFLDGASIYVVDNKDHYLSASLYGIAISNGKETCYLNVDEIKKNKEVLSYLKDTKKKKIGFDVKRAYHVFYNEGIEISFSDDAMIVATLVDSTLTSPERIYAKHGLETSRKYEDIFGKPGKTSLFVDENDAASYAMQQAEFIYEIYETDRPNIEAYEMTTLYQDVEFPLSYILFEMEREGIRCDEAILSTIAEETYKKMELEQKEVYALANKEFNLNSPKQLGEVLFDDLALPSNKKRSTSADVLEKLVGIHPIIEHILSYRKLTKLYSTYAEGLKKYILNDGKIHTIYNQCATQTGRLSSSEPNLQNISVRDEAGKEIRKAFLADEGCVLISSDYHQIELRILAHMANEESLIQAFKDDIDIHTKTAMDIFNKKKEEVDSQERRQAKTVNFGIVYGISDFGLAEQLGVSRYEAKEFIDAYYRAYPGIKKYMQSIISFCEEKGYVETLLKRRREIPEIHDKNYNMREFGKRAAMNAPIQGTAADLIKIAMIHIDLAMKEKKVKSKMILQVHDELIFNVVEEEIELMKELINEGMIHAMEFKVPLTAECSIGHNWYEAK